jgi:hypothetical protein
LVAKKVPKLDRRILDRSARAQAGTIDEYIYSSEDFDCAINEG